MHALNSVSISREEVARFMVSCARKYVEKATDVPCGVSDEALFEAMSYMLLDVSTYVVVAGWDANPS